jgi:aminopeptidase N
MTNDPHSFEKPNELIVKHLNLHLVCDFIKKTLHGYADWTFERKSESDTLVLDTRDLLITKVQLDGDTSSVAFTLDAPDPILGSALRIRLKPETQTVRVYYSTLPDAPALQWLSPAQTAGGKSPFLFTQSQAILARTWIPVQDSPGIRFTYEATVQVPTGMLALMSARNPEKKSADGIYHFQQVRPVPAYLMALAAGDIEFAKLSDRTGVYAEPITLETARRELEDMPKMLTAAEKLYGPYEWGKYDVLILPPSFPFGGMENPCLTFATPTILAGDKSLTSLIAHELAHSWSGNLVTNKTWNDFWLNEGFTVYFERRIMEDLYGKSYSDMLAELGFNDLTGSLEAMKKDGHWDDTKLKLNLNGRDPDDGMNDIAYEKGYLFLCRIEQITGREKFDKFLNDYFAHFAFKGADTEEFLKYLHSNLILEGSAEDKELNANQWIYQPGIPINIKPVISKRFEAVRKVAAEFSASKNVEIIHPEGWSSNEWQCFLRSLSDSIGASGMALLDHSFHFTERRNSEEAFLWYMLAIRNNYATAWPAMEKFLLTVGRRKFVAPLYREMQHTDWGKSMAREIYSRARPGYHSVTTGTVDAIIDLPEHKIH